MGTAAASGSFDRVRQRAQNAHQELSKDEFEDAVRSICHLPRDAPLPDHLLDRHWSYLGVDKDGTIDFEKFLVWSTRTAYTEEILVPDLKERRIRQIAKEHGLYLPDVERIKSIFDKYDGDKNGTIEWLEFKKMFDASVQWHEFVVQLAKGIERTGKLTDAVLRREFCQIDKDMNGSLDIDELSQVFKNLNISIDEPTLKKLLMVADADGSMALEWAEFKRMFDVVKAVSAEGAVEYGHSKKSNALKDKFEKKINMHT